MAQQLINVGGAINDGTGEVGPRGWLQKINANETELYLAANIWDSTVIASQYAGSTTELKIVAAIMDALAKGKRYCWVSQSMLPYNPTLVTNLGAFAAARGRMVREGGNPALFEADAYGAQASDVGDDTAALQAACDAATQVGGGFGGGGVVGLSAVTYLISSTLFVPQGVVIRGAGRTASMIKANTSFPTSTPLITLGKVAEGAVFGTRLEELMVNCNDITGSIGVSSTKVNELCGLYHVLVDRFKGTGVDFTTSVCQNWFIQDCEVYFSATAPSSAIGINVNSTGTIRGIDNVSMVVNTFANIQATGIRLNGCAGVFSRIHVEQMLDGILIGDVTACSGVTIVGCTGGPNITNLVRIRNATTNQNITLTGLSKAGGTNVLVDEIKGVTLTSSDLGLYVLGDGGSPNQGFLTTSTVTPFQRLNSGLNLASSIQVGERVVSGVVTMTSGTTPSLDASKGNFFRLTILTNIAVVIAIPTNPPAAGQSQDISISIRNGSGGVLTTPPTFNTGGGGFKFTTVTNPANGTQVLYLFRWDATTGFWYQIGTQQAAGL